MLKLFRANDFDKYLDDTVFCPPKHLITETTTILNPDYSLWNLIDQNLATALYAVISPPLLPSVLSLDTCATILATIDHQLHSTNWSRLLQLKNELHNISKIDKTMTTYLSNIKQKIDAMATTGPSLSLEDVRLYSLNELSSTYQPFKTTIRTNLNPISLDDFYLLLCSEETNLAIEATKELQQLSIT